VFVNDAQPDMALPANPHNGAHRVFFKTAAGSMNVTGNGELIEGSSTYSLEDGTSIFVFANGAWVVIRDDAGTTPAGPFFKLLTFDSLSSNERTEVAISGTTIAMSAVTSTEARVYVYDKNPVGDDWPVTQVITGGGRFGSGIDMDGDWMAIGNADSNAEIWYRAGGPGTQWVQENVMTTAPAGRFGEDLSIDMTPFSGDIGSVAICDWVYDVQNGRVSVYTCPGAFGGWSLQQTISSPVGGILHEFGRSVDITGDELLVGAAVESVDISRSGYVYYFTRAGNGTWSPQQEITDPADDSVGRFGKQISRDGEWLAIGADRSGGGANLGVVYIYRLVTGSWVLQQTLGAPATTLSFGISLSMANGTLLVGTTINEAHAYTLSGSTWSFQRTIDSPDSYVNNGFGLEVATDDGTTSVFAAHKDSEIAASTSAGYVGDWSDI